MAIDGKVTFHTDHGGRAYMKFTWDGQLATVHLRQPAAVDGLLSLGPRWAGRVSAILPADPDNGRLTERQMDGFIDDPVAMEWYDKLWEHANGEPRPK